MDLPKVLVMMSTYNGERYVAEQLDSIYAQRGVNVHLLVRDDGSRDSTISILRKYLANGRKLTILQEKNIGAAYSFYELIRYAAEEMSVFEYYAFADQDDVWLDDKLLSAILLMQQSNNQYMMAYCDWQPTDSELNPIHLHQEKDLGSIGANIVSNHIAGCIQVLNRNLFVKLNSINSPEAKKELGKPMFFHDSWSAAVAYALGADILHDAHPRMYYRQHGNNVVGAGKGGVFMRLYTRSMRYLKNKGRSKSMKCEYIRLCLWDDVTDENRRFIDLCANYRNSFVKRLHLWGCKQLYEYGFEENVGVFFLVLINKF